MRWRAETYRTTIPCGTIRATSPKLTQRSTTARQPLLRPRRVAVGEHHDQVGSRPQRYRRGDAGTHVGAAASLQPHFARAAHSAGGAGGGVAGEHGDRLLADPEGAQRPVDLAEGATEELVVDRAGRVDDQGDAGQGAPYGREHDTAHGTGATGGSADTTPVARPAP